MANAVHFVPPCRAYSRQYFCHREYHSLTFCPSASCPCPSSL
ncbi:unnamed protein product [Gulo gulo]|uniref:Uncharacterized protein n=1 Tax=Gulo gulo TaxID=48420 RepID=A0A9X9PZ01_GULGU|nr:unnamed protein product [Gulo gulo]